MKDCHWCYEWVTWLRHMAWGHVRNFRTLDVTDKRRKLKFPSNNKLDCFLLASSSWMFIFNEVCGSLNDVSYTCITSFYGVLHVPWWHVPRPQSLSSRHSSNVRSAEATTHASYGEFNSWKIGILNLLIEECQLDLMIDMEFWFDRNVMALLNKFLNKTLLFPP